MADIKKKIEIKPKSNAPKINIIDELNSIREKIKEVKIMVKELEYEDTHLDEKIDQQINIELLNGEIRKGILKDIGKYELVFEEEGKLVQLFKHSILCYYF